LTVEQGEALAFCIESSSQPKGFLGQIGYKL
jgi:hypothetical protein